MKTEKSAGVSAAGTVRSRVCSCRWRHPPSSPYLRPCCYAGDAIAQTSWLHRLLLSAAFVRSPPPSTGGVRWASNRLRTEAATASRARCGDCEVIRLANRRATRAPARAAVELPSPPCRVLAVRRSPGTPLGNPRAIYSTAVQHVPLLCHDSLRAHTTRRSLGP